MPRGFKTFKAALAAYERVEKSVRMPFEQWLFGEEVERRTIHCGSDAAEFIRLHVHLPTRREISMCILLDANHETLCAPVRVSRGLLNGTPCGCREVFSTAVWWQAACIIFCHNHPSANLLPSEKDIKVTEALWQAGDILGIRLVDHVIVNRVGHSSLLEDGYYDFKTGRRK